MCDVERPAMHLYWPAGQIFLVLSDFIVTFFSSLDIFVSTEFYIFFLDLREFSFSFYNHVAQIRQVKAWPYLFGLIARARPREPTTQGRLATEILYAAR
jgi:hypothetical protein